jgi:predicted ATPase
LIARDGRVDAAWQALQSARLLTLTGPGGSGKTRLAMELASRSGTSAWVELASLTDPRALAEHAATTLGVPGRSGKPDVSNIVERFAAQSMVLVLDNCEHVVDAAAAFVAQLLRECPGLKVLATSREALGVAGERIVSVPPLSVPHDNTLASAREADAIALFVERAQDVRAGFELTARNAAAVARICRRLDGIPLAIELAAARVRALDPEELAERLESSIGLLETGSRAALPRHRTIRDTIDWSYKLLSDDERRMLRRLSVFHGTFSLDAVEGVCAEPGAGCAGALDIVTALLDKSLLSCDAGDAGTRYRLLETVREYAAERLREAGETDAIRERHAKFFVSLAERAAPAIFGGASDEGWMARLDEEITNFRDAQDWCEQQPSRLSLALRIAVAIHWYWYARGLFNEGRLRVGIALTFAENVEPVLRGRALTVLGRLAIWQGDHAHVHGPMEEAVDVLRTHGDPASLAYALHGLGIAAGLQGRVDDARRTIDEAAALADNSGRPGVPVVWVEYWRGLIAEWDRNPDAARQCYESALAAARRIGHKAAIGHSLCVLGRLAAAAGRREAAELALGESFEIFRDIGDRWGSAFALEGAARVAAVAGNAERTAKLLGAAEGLREDLGIDLTPPAQAFHDATIAMVRNTRDETMFWRAWGEGKMRPLEVAIGNGDAREAAAASVSSAAGAMPVADLRIRMFGAFEAYVGNRRVEKTDWGSSRARELLAFLACHPEGCTKSQIGLALWPDASPGQLRNTFHVTLHRLRNALALMDAIQVDNDRYRLNPSLSRDFDVEQFEQGARNAMKELRRGSDSTAALTEAIARYQGDFLAGASAGEWVEERRDRLQRLYIEALDALGRAQMKNERYAEAAEAFRLLLVADPVNEEACRRQMTCLAQLGDRGAALRAYDALARALRDELGVRPERETSALREKLSSNSAV